MVRLPYRKELNWYLLGYSGLYLVGECVRVHVVLRPALAALLFRLHAGLFLFVLLSLTPLFAFRPAGKATPDQAILRINVMEVFVWSVAGIAGFFCWIGLLDYTEGYDGGIPIAIKSASVAIILLLALNSRKILFRDDLIPYEVEQELAKRKADPGPFTYTAEGFTYAGKQPFQCQWAAIEGIIAYKTDSFAYDTVRLILKRADGEEWHLHEDAAGWFIFTDQLETHLQGVNPIWQMEAIADPFATNATLVYKRGEDLAQEWNKRTEHPEQP